jgi:hypothetical protein
LFSAPDAEYVKWFTEQLLTVDKEFPVSGNAEELRLMAGVVMVAIFEESSNEGDAFALGLGSMSFQNRTTQPAQPEILSIAQSYLRAEGEKQRPIECSDSTPSAEKALNAKYKEVEEAETTGDEAEIQATRSAYNKSVIRTIQEKNTLLNGQIRRLAEESAILWWVLGEYSPLLQRRTAEIESSDYALVVAAEAADRTSILPPPRSIDALLARALAPCKKGTKKNPTLAHFLNKTKGDWRADYLQRLNYSECEEFVPFTIGLAKAREFNDASAAIKVLPQLCRGFDASLTLSPEQVANQFYIELCFTKSLSLIGKS